ncbi:MAG: histidinol dehydrogenase, partial [Isosphaeraceae bacterium]
ERICSDVAARGLAAVLDYTHRLDGVALEPGTVRVSRAELESAHESADAGYLQTLENVRANILAYQRAILNRDVGIEPTLGIELGVRYVPLRRVGVCIPGGAAAYPSTLLMTVVPAQAAGVAEIAVVAPPTRFGGYNTDLLAACHALGVTEVHRIGGAQAVAALAYGVEGVPAVDKIVGPGNLFVALAKKQVYGEVDIDSIAGPSEVVLIADASADPRYVASDLISQAEHSPGVSILLTWEPALIDRVAVALDQQLGWLGRGDLARDSLARFGALIQVRDEAEAVRLSNLLAPEHLHISTIEPRRLLPALTSAGAIFLGHHTPVAVGDYAAGPSHVLPTGGTARWASGLSANDFLKRSSLISVTRDGLARLAPDIRRLADIEGLSAHRFSVDVRLSDPSQFPGCGCDGRRRAPCLWREESALMSTEFAAAGEKTAGETAAGSQSAFSIRPARPADAATIANLVYELAVYEKLEQFARATPDDFRRHLFGPRPYAEAIVAEIDGEPVGFALFFPTFSSFRGQPGLYVEDVYVRPVHRGRGVGKALLAKLAKLAMDRGLGRLEWAVLNWNSPAIGFYRSLGARPLEDWTVYRINDGPLAELAALAPSE